jgi:hypothetical protein
MKARIFAKEELLGEVTLDAQGRATWSREVELPQDAHLQPPRAQVSRHGTGERFIQTSHPGSTTARGGGAMASPGRLARSCFIRAFS